MIKRYILIPLLLVGVSAYGQSLPETVSLDTVLALASEANPRLSLERQSVEAAQADRRTAGAYPNPTVSYGKQRQGGTQTQYDGKWSQNASIEFPLLIAGQRGVRVEAAEKGIDAARARVAASGNDLSADAGAAYIALLAAQERRGALTSSLKELERLREIVAGRQSSGMASEYDLLRMDIEQESWRSRVAEAEADLVDKQSQLAALLGFSGWKPRASGLLRPLEVRPEAALPTNNPSLIAAKKEEEFALAGVEVARRERFPNVSINASRTSTSDPFGAATGLGISVEIPILDTRGGAVDRARVEAQSSAFRRQILEAEIQSDLSRYAAQVTHRSNALEQFRLRMASRFPALKQMAEDAYRLGKGSIVELLDATRTRFETQLAQIDLTANLLEAQVRWLAVSGKLSSLNPSTR
jgi:cobalt-zinc-cadmium efflux system outer membrane protein